MGAPAKPNQVPDKTGALDHVHLVPVEVEDPQLSQLSKS